jgi:hypothetical protein
VEKIFNQYSAVFIAAALMRVTVVFVISRKLRGLDVGRVRQSLK